VRLTAPTEVAEYKQVTVLFADVVGSMDIAAALDPERLREVMTELVERCAAVLRRYGGSVEYNGDGVMALFGAPVALEDHAYRACLAALEVQDEARRLAAEVQQHDGLDFHVRVGLNSGRVIAGKIGSGALGYAATGETVGFAQRMESVAPPGGVTLSESTARLVEDQAVVAGPEYVRVKGVDEPVTVFQLASVSVRGGTAARAEASLVGRRWEIAALDAMVDRAIGGRGGVVSVLGPPGIGKSRVAREVAAVAASRGVEVVWTYCVSHAREVPFYLVTQLLRAVMGLADLDDACARRKLRDVLPETGEQDLLLLEDLLGFAGPDGSLPAVNPDARRRRLTAMVNTASLARTTPALVIIEDAHWIDVVSESMVAELLSVVPRTGLMVLITARPEYHGQLSRMSGAQAIALAPLSDSDTAVLLGELMGSDSSVDELAAIIIDRSQGNPFFAEEMVRELAQRGVLTGKPGEYLCGGGVSEVTVPTTVQAAIAARIDGLSPSARRTLSAASVIGERFSADLVSALGDEGGFTELIHAELIDQVRFAPTVEYAFRHPLIHAVAYESQLKSDRAVWHTRLAAEIEQREPDSVDENAALIARHLHAAGHLHSAYGWHMRAGAWSANREVLAARLNWERACRIADALSDDDAEKLSMRIAPRTMLAVTDFHAQAADESRGRFAELRQLCSAAGDKVSLAIGMTGQATELLYASRGDEAARLASEQMDLLESIGDPTLTVGLGFVAFACWYNVGEFQQISRWTQIVIDLADGDPTRGSEFGFGSPLAAATVFRGIAGWWRGHPGWREDLAEALAMGRKSDPTTLGYILAWTYGIEIVAGVSRPDDAALGIMEGALAAAEETSNDNAVLLVEYSLAIVLLYRDGADDRRRGLALLERTLAMLQRRVPSLVPVTQMWVAKEKARLGTIDTVKPVMRQAVELLLTGRRIGYCVFGAATYVEALLEYGDEHDWVEARDIIERLVSLRGENDSAVLHITILRLRTLLARARGEEGFLDLAGRYRTMAESLGFDGHIAWAEALQDSGRRAPL
jgi:class 3 adenylate cyclase